MSSSINRRDFVAAAAALGATAGFGQATSGQAVADGVERRIVGLSCSPRRGKTTAQALGIALAAAREADAAVDTELIELAGMDIPVFVPGSDRRGDFDALAERLVDPSVAGVILGTPVYFCSPTSLCKAFLDHCSVFRARGFQWANRIAGVLAVGGVRNGGQELTIQCVQAALMCQEMIVVGDGRPTAHLGATLVNRGDDDIGDDGFGVETARNLGWRVAQAVRWVAVGAP